MTIIKLRFALLRHNSQIIILTLHSIPTAMQSAPTYCDTDLIDEFFISLEGLNRLTSSFCIVKFQTIERRLLLKPESLKLAK